MGMGSMPVPVLVLGAYEYHWTSSHFKNNIYHINISHTMFPYCSNPKVYIIHNCIIMFNTFH